MTAAVRLFLLGTALAATTGAVPAFADDGKTRQTLTPLVVTATRTAVDPATVGSSVTVIDGDDLRRAGTVFVVAVL